MFPRKFNSRLADRLEGMSFIQLNQEARWSWLIWIVPRIRPRFDWMTAARGFLFDQCGELPALGIELDRYPPSSCFACWS